MVIGVRHKIKRVVVVFVPSTERPKSSLDGIQALLLVLEVTIAVYVRKHSRVIDRYQRHLNDMGKRVVISELRQVLAIVNRCVYESHWIWIGLEEVPVDSLSPSGSTKDIWFPILNDETDEREGSKTFVGIEVSCMEWEEDEGIDIRADPWFPQVDGAFLVFVFFWWSWTKAW
jgi:hypothetical protein